jgi:flagellar biosynthesis anti-sigma factor FlgM
MSIRNGIENLSQIFPAQAVQPTKIANGGSVPQSESLADDKAQLSAVAKQVAQTAGASDVRWDKVATIQSALQSGTYHVSAADVAQRVITSLLAPGN